MLISLLAGLLFAHSTALASDPEAPIPLKNEASHADFLLYKGRKKLNFSPKVNKLDSEGIALLGQGKNEEAVKVFGRSLKLMPKNPRALANRGAAWLGLGDPDQALRDFDKAAAAYPELKPAIAASMSSAHVRRGRKRFDAGKTQEALEDFYAAVRLDRTSASAYSEISFVAGRTRQYDACLSYAGRAIELAPKFPDGYANRGACLDAMGRRRDALKDLDQAIRLDPSRAPWFASRASVNAGLGLHAQALRDARRAVELDASLKDLMAPLIQGSVSKARRQAY